MITKNYICFFALLFSIPAYADNGMFDDVSLSVGIGKNWADERSDGNWRQRYSPHANDNDLSDRALGLEINGPTRLSWLRWTAGLRYLGYVRAHGDCWYSDADYFAGNFSAPCSQLTVKSMSRGIILSLDPTHCNGAFCVSAQVGAYIFESRFHGYEHGRSIFRFHETGHTPFLGANVSYGPVRLHYGADKWGHSTTSPGAGNRTVMLFYTLL
jgi:hypothetical protein